MARETGESNPAGLVARLFPGLALDPDDGAELLASIACRDRMPQAEWKARFNLLVQAASALEAMGAAHLTVLRTQLDQEPYRRAKRVYDSARDKFRHALGGEA